MGRDLVRRWRNRGLRWRHPLWWWRGQLAWWRGQLAWWHGQLAIHLSYHIHKQILCRMDRHYRKFDTYPVRGMCIYCKAKP